MKSYINVIGAIIVSVWAVVVNISMVMMMILIKLSIVYLVLLCFLRVKKCTEEKKDIYNGKVRTVLGCWEIYLRAVTDGGSTATH